MSLPRYKHFTSSVISRLTVLVTVSMLAGCSLLSSVPIPGMDYIAGEEGLLRDRKADYLEAEVLPPTRIPAQYDSYIIDDLMVIPQAPGANTLAYLDAPRPRPFAGRSERGVVIQRMNEESWIVVDVSPSEVWPRIRDYWTRQSIQVDFENPTGGILDTGWFVLEGNVLTKEKMRVTVEPGFQNDSAEIRLQHLSADQAIPTIGQVTWPEASVDEELAYDFLADMSSYLADIADLYQASTVSFLAENIDRSGKASLVTGPQGQEILRLEADFSRSWGAIGRALDRVGVNVVSENRDQGLIEVDYIINPESEEDKPGFFKRVATFNGILSRKEDVRSFQLKIQLFDLGDEVEVLVESLELLPQPTLEDQDAAASLLKLIRNSIA